MKVINIYFLFLSSLLFGGFGLFGCSAQAYAQELILFQAVEKPPVASSTSPTKPKQDAPRRSSEPAFTLKGTSRFGDNYQSSLVARNGNDVSVSWKEGAVNEIDGYRGYSVIHVDARTISLRLPSGEGCVESSEKGVSCPSEGVALLKLSNVDPLQKLVARNDLARVERDELELNGNQTDELGQEAQSARVARPRGRGRDAELVRIPDGDVPEGMRVVRTPFGDRLVPD